MDLKKIAKMQIGGPKYPDKKRINLYQREVKKGAVHIGSFQPFISNEYNFPFSIPYYLYLVLRTSPFSPPLS